MTQTPGHYTEHGTRKYQANGPIGWGRTFRAVGGKEGYGIRAALAFAIDRGEAFLDWARKNHAEQANAWMPSRLREGDVDAAPAKAKAGPAKAKAKAGPAKAKAKAGPAKARAKAVPAKARAKVGKVKEESKEPEQVEMAVVK